MKHVGRGQPTTRAAALLFICGCAAHAESSIESSPSVTIGTANSAIVVDGDLAKPAWATAPSFELSQQSPSPGKTTPFKTTVRVLRDRRHIYFAVSCEDPRPSNIAVHTLQRDVDQSNDDNVTIILDSYGQKKLAYVLQVNAGGALADGLVSPGYTNLNTNSPVDYSWNGYWRAAVRRSATGWMVEIALDTQSLQFDSKRSSWGLNVSRYVPRSQLTLAWSGINLNATATNLQWEGRMDGMPGLSQGSGLEVDPYVLLNGASGKNGLASKAGFDVKYNFTPQLAGLASYHTDFSEAPSNLLNVTASPYAQSIPETRAFFLDGANIFSFSHNLGQNFIPFYSRSIGLVGDDTVPMEGGVKLLGHAGPWTMGFLDASMAASDASASTSLFAARAVYEINDEWRIGTLATHGDPTGHTSNSLISFDSTWSTAHFAGDHNLNASAWGARTISDPVAGTPVGYGVDLAYPNDLWWMDFNYNYYGNALDPALGFIQRPGTKQTFGDINWQPRPSSDSIFSAVRQFDLYSTFRYVTDLDDRVQSQEWQLIPVQFTTQTGWYAFGEINPTYEVLSAPYQIVPHVILPTGEYHFTNAYATLATPHANSWQFTLEAESGALYSGHYRATNPVFAWSAPDGRFTASLRPSLLWFDSPQGSGSVRAQRLSLAYAFSPSMTLSTLTQYNNANGQVTANTLYQWIIAPNRTLFVVWNHGSTPNPNVLQGGRTIAGDSAVVKLSWGFY
jgi:Carbohydrate family 9 binding domain-like